MISRRIGFVLLTLLSGEALAEKGTLNLSIEPGSTVDTTSEQGNAKGTGLGFQLDWVISRRIALQARYQGALFSFIDPVTQLEVNKLTGLLSGGLRLYPALLDDKKGYKVHAGSKRGHEGNLWGNLWVDAGIGAGFDGVTLSEKELSPKLDMGLGYNLSLIDGLLVGPFVRTQISLIPPEDGASIGVAASDATLFLAGLTMTIALPARGMHERDSDDDGLIDADEATRGTDKLDADTDNDGIKDGAEVLGKNPTNPLSKDTDQDTLTDGHEDLNANGAIDYGETDPNHSDSDAGGLTDGSEELDLSNPLDNRDDDQDSDGVHDSIDTCPQTPKRIVVNEKGCAVLDRDLVLEGSLFTKGKAVLLSSSYTALQRIAVILKDNPSIKVEIGAHDPSAGGGKGKTLTQSRADAIREYLISQGVPAEQMTAKGYGAEAPAASKSKSGRIELRRFGDNGALLNPYPTKK